MRKATLLQVKPFPDPCETNVQLRCARMASWNVELFIRIQSAHTFIGKEQS